MYTPPAFRIDDRAEIHAMMRACRLATLVTATSEGLLATPLPLILAPEEGEFGVLHGHLARANPQWKAKAIGEAMVLFNGPDAYVTPSWYETKRETGKVVPTWNYQAVHAYGPAEFFDDPARLLDAVTRLTNLHEGTRAEPWAVDDAPPAFVQAQLRGIVGLRIPITRLEGKRKMSQNRPLADRVGVAEGLGASERPSDLVVAAMVPTEG
ncbi:transcriptional regulator [Bosea sp. Tri-44]|uniref:FMN-binding negative transcriptional regulator n=1 Tax=Bosea sp. Tri-44 TaxID=1972137 RepID=UPI00100F7359|nr:FMN-binding negative transcriptional regulator [Bosea sp. Tri-44]RXT56476.1 transcriptional regulator [Bosea sp. Tri-44]